MAVNTSANELLPEAGFVPPDRPDATALGGSMRRGLAWKAASQITAQVSRTAMTVILARLLLPAEFGVAGMVLVFSGLIMLLSDIGFSASIIQLESLTEDDRCTAFWSSLAVSLALFGAAVLVAPFVAAFYHRPQLRWMFVAVCFGFITAALNSTQASLLWRRMEFRALEVRTMLSTVVASAVAIVAAFAGLGAWSLIAYSVSLGVVSTITIWIMSPWKPSLRFSRVSLKRMGSFSAKIFAARFFGYGDRNADNLLIARFLGAHALGVYAIGYSVIIVPFDRLLSPLLSVLVPAFASLQKDISRMSALWLRGVRLSAAVMFPATTGVMLVAPEFVSVVLGGRWSEATPIIQILAWVALVQSLNVLNGAIYQSRSRSGLVLLVSSVAFTVDLASFVIGLHWGIKGVATAYAIANTFLIVPANVLITSRLMGVRISALASELRGVLEATVVMAASLLLLRLALQSTAFSAAVRLTMMLVTGIAVYGLMCWWRERRLFAEFGSRQLSAITG